MTSTEENSSGFSTPVDTKTLDVTSSLNDLQTDEQRRVLDTVAQVRRCGLDSILSLPQLVVCGDQSAGKSSVLEAITKIPFPRADNLCTRFATEIILRNGPTDTIRVKVIPDDARPQTEKKSIEAFQESITDFGDLPKIMELARTTMGITTSDTPDGQARAFSRDVLSIEIEGPLQPQLTLVDIPGLIQTSTKGVSDADVDLVAEITDAYISQHRTICLAVVSATNDAANQPILRRVRQYDPEGERTLGIITKPDRLPAGSGMESKFLELARNEDVHFKLGWHVLKNRAWEEGDSTLFERNAAEATYFRTSNFKSLPKEHLGIDSLKARLVSLLFNHVKQEMPRLRQDLEAALHEANGQLEQLGSPRSSPAECKAYLSGLSMEFYDVCKSAVNGQYEGDYFINDAGKPFSINSAASIARLRAVVQYLNTQFSHNIRQNGHKYQIDMANPDRNDQQSAIALPQGTANVRCKPKQMSKDEALRWIRETIIQNRGRELQGNFNPLIIGTLFWEQSSNWKQLATDHMEHVAQICERFLDDLLTHKCPKDVKTNLWSSLIMDALKDRRAAALKELDLNIEDFKHFPVNYNHYYTDTIHKRRQERHKKFLEESLESATEHTLLPGCRSDHTSASIDVREVVESFSTHVDHDMENFSCEEALDCLFAIYKVSQSPFPQLTF
jgi:GTPase SAR1 family protein